MPERSTIFKLGNNNCKKCHPKYYGLGGQRIFVNRDENLLTLSKSNVFLFN